MKSHWIIYNDKRVFISDFSNCGTNAEMVQDECEAIRKVLVSEPDKSVLVVVNVEGTFVNDQILQAFRDLLPTTNKYVKRRTVIGLSGFRKHFIFLVSKFVGDVNFSPFDTLDDALEWLTQS